MEMGRGDEEGGSLTMSQIRPYLGLPDPPAPMSRSPGFKFPVETPGPARPR